MENCLKTQLKDVVNNNSLEKIGEMKIKNNVVANPTSNTQSITFHNQGNDVSLKIVNNDGNNSHHFTNAALGADLGTSLTSPSSGTYYTVYVTPGSEISVISKYELLSLIEITSDGIANNSWSFSINDLKYSDINNLRLTKSCTGDAASLKGKVLNALNYPALITTENYSVIGGIKGIINNCTPKYIQEVPSAQSGEPKFFSLDVSDFQYDNLVDITAPRNMIIKGDLATLGKNCNFINMVKDSVPSSTWTSRHSASAATVLMNVNLGGSLGTYLKNIANCDHSVEPIAKTISVYGTYDTADTELADAIATIKSWSGYSVSINGSLV